LCAMHGKVRLLMSELSVLDKNLAHLQAKVLETMTTNRALRKQLEFAEIWIKGQKTMIESLDEKVKSLKNQNDNLLTYIKEVGQSSFKGGVN